MILCLTQYMTFGQLYQCSTFLFFNTHYHLAYGAAISTKHDFYFYIFITKA